MRDISTATSLYWKIVISVTKSRHSTSSLSEGIGPLYVVLDFKMVSTIMKQGTDVVF